jgi:hypothetical protein
MTVEALEAEDSVISESLELSKSPFSTFKIARTTSKNESEKEVEYSMDENFENDDYDDEDDDDDDEGEGSIDEEKSKIAFSKQFIDSTNRSKVPQNIQNKMNRNDIIDSEKEDEYLDSFIEDEEESVVLGGRKFRENESSSRKKGDTKKNEKDFQLSESFQEIDEDDEVVEKVVKKGGKVKDNRISEIEDSYENEVNEVENEDISYRANNLSRTTPSQGRAFGAPMGRNLGSKSLPYPSRIDEDEDGEVEDEDDERENERERERERRGYGNSVGGVRETGTGIGSVKEVEEDGKEEEDDYDDCSYSRDFEQSRFAIS